MDNSKMKAFFKNAQSKVSKHTPEILIGVGIAGMITTTVLAVKETPKALKLIEDKKKLEQKDELTPVEVVKTTWKCYIPAVTTGVLSTACLIGASSVSARRNATLATAYKLSETALTEYREKVVETIGEKKEKTVRDKVAEEKVKKNPVSKNEVLVTEKGNTLCMDALSSRYFTSDIEKIRKAENDINKRMLSESYVSLNDFYSEIGLSSMELGDDLGWNVDRDGLLEIYFTSTITDDGRPCIVMNYEVAPKYDYSKFL